ncbi:MAG: nucleotidyltransferase family protein [Candidatus Melainabacteria bacterium]|jgi:predicted nucleotidyltransferase
MKTLEEIQEILKREKVSLSEKYNIAELGIFGSYVRGEQQENSDLDVLVEYKGKVSFFDILHLEEELSQLSGMKVDLVLKSGLKKFMGQQIMKEVEFL